MKTMRLIQRRGKLCRKANDLESQALAIRREVSRLTAEIRKKTVVKL